MTEKRPRIDGPGATKRLEAARRTPEGDGELPPEEAQRILTARALKLAQPPALDPIPRGEVLDLLVLSIGAERYGIEARHVVDVLRPTELTRVPCTPDFVLGVFNHRGRIVPALDLQRLLGRAGSDAAGPSHVVTVEAGGMTFGIAAAAVSASIRVGADDLVPLPEAAPGSGSRLVRGATAEMVAVLDTEALARDPRVVVNEEVG